MLGRELAVIRQRPAFAACLCAHVAVLAVFVLAWGDGRGVPVLRDDFYFQVRLMQLMLLSVLLPWVAARCLADERGDELVFLSAVTACRPSLMMLARAVAAWIALAVLVLAGLPVVLLARQISMTPLARVFRDEALMIAIAAVACSGVLAFREVSRGRLTTWLAGAAVTAGVVMAARLALVSPPAIGMVLVAAACMVALLLAERADRACRYLSGRA